MRSFYPEKVNDRFNSPKHSGKAADANGIGTDAAFICGSFVRFSLSIDTSSKEIIEVKFQTNGCGFMIAAADVLAGEIIGRGLAELHGLNSEELRRRIENELGEFPQSRGHCVAVCVDALHAAFADHRAYQIEEFRGETALICTCFGIAEETIVSCITQNSHETVEEVTGTCRAGSGCGSCRMLIQELIDIRHIE